MQYILSEEEYKKLGDVEKVRDSVRQFIKDVAGSTRRDTFSEYSLAIDREKFESACKKLKESIN
jgi:hypothetical protein